jgi:hypothetical protein
MERTGRTSWIPLQVPVEDSLCHLKLDTLKREGRGCKVKNAEGHVAQTPPQSFLRDRNARLRAVLRPATHSHEQL